MGRQSLIVERVTVGHAAAGVRVAPHTSMTEGGRNGRH